MKKKNFIYKNEEFVCENCGELNTPNRPEIRNHCRFCLWSKHLDDEVPGDRLSDCGGMLRPVDVDYNKKKGWVLIFECVKCGLETRNMVVSDDDMELVSKISAEARKRNI